MNPTIVLTIGVVVLFSGIVAISRTLSRLERVVDNMEAATVVVAKDLTVAKAVVETVASDLALAQQRADDIVSGEPGEAADAGAQSEK